MIRIHVYCDWCGFAEEQTGNRRPKGWVNIFLRTYGDESSAENVELCQRCGKVAKCALGKAEGSRITECLLGRDSGGPAERSTKK